MSCQFSVLNLISLKPADLTSTLLIKKTKNSHLSHETNGYENVHNLKTISGPVYGEMTPCYDVIDTTHLLQPPITTLT